MNIESGFRDAMRDAGIETHAAIVADGELHRVHVNGDRAASKNGFYRLYADAIPAGVFGCHKRGILQKWRSDQKREPLTKHDRAQMDAACKARAMEQERGYSDAAVIGEQILQRAKGDASQEVYVTRKAIRPHGVKVNGHGLLVIPIYSSVNGQLQSVQFIDPDGNKKMLIGGRVSGGCFPFSDMPNFWANADSRIGVCEGWATGATLAESLPTTAIFAAFSAGNLGNVATALRARFATAQITVFGDNDQSGTGQKYAIDAAVNANGYVAIPPIPGHDWNDYASRRAA